MEKMRSKDRHKKHRCELCKKEMRKEKLLTHKCMANGISKRQKVEEQDIMFWCN